MTRAPGRPRPGPPVRIRGLTPDEAPLVAACYRAAPDYWLLAQGACDPDGQDGAFFTDAPPGCDPRQSLHLGLFLPPPVPLGALPSPGGAWGEMQLSLVAELSFGFPTAADAYLGRMLLGPWAQRSGHGRRFLARVEQGARARGLTRLCLAVLDANPRGRAFWEREGFRDTGVVRHDAATGHRVARLSKPLV